MENDYPVQDYYEIIHPLTAQVLARFKGEGVENLPAITENNYGKGIAYHIGGRMDTESLLAFYQSYNFV